MRAAFLASLSAALLCPLALAQPAMPPGPYPGHSVVRVNPATPDDCDRVFDLVTGVWSCRIGPGPLDVQVTPAQRDALEAAGFATEMRIPDVQALLDAERAQIAQAQRDRDAAWFSTFRTLTEIHTRLDYYQATYPALATAFTAGQTLQGRPIRGVRITGPDQPGNPRSARPAVLFNSCQHAREWATPMTAMWIADRLIEDYATDARLRDLVDRCEVIVIPVVNCDGYEFTWLPNNRLWRKNRRDNGDGTFGVDPNRNWGYQWGGEGASTSTNSETYRGTGPFSEPETQVMRDFMTANPHLRAHIDIHSYSQLILTPWSYTAADCPDRAIFRRVEADMASSIRAVHGRTYVAGPTYTTIYPASGGALDWTYGDRGMLGSSIEVRDTGSYGFVMPAAEIIPNAQENFEGAFTLALYAASPLIFAQNSPLPTTLSPGSPAPVDIAVRASAATLAGPPSLMVSLDGGTFNPTAMTPVAGSVYAASLPPAGCGQQVRYYFRAQTTSGLVVTYPAAGESQAFAASGVGSAVRFADDMESDRGWTVGAPGDNATAGLWERADPQPTAAQPGDDYTPPPGVLCWITGAAAGGSVGANDVDGGTTTLTSPVFDARPATYTRVSATRLSYARWYSNNQGSNPNSDSMPVFISNDSGATWTLLEDVTQNAGAWVVASFRLEDYITPTRTMRLRFVARDLGGGSVVEAGVDDVLVEVLGCAPDLDLNQDGNADQDDVAYLINIIAGGQNPTGIDPDFNQDGNIDQQDVVDFIDAIAGG
jgi:murein tripeptide amidase MpaA